MENNFSVILAKKLWGIGVVSENTGISRTTLTNLYYQRAKGIQFDTLFKICDFLECTPNDLLLIKKNEEI
ncbi:helix-turn-helix domain-containing protein [Bacillus cereus]|uniref:HTH cro/C1-type domain-containing protein n=1 Tax=Bacillus cereus VD184 TaxID=1053242 RepID=A0A9W5RCQ5_BACCE|nr:helix-turn-helix domain-containing protein [Bacillus cereus]EOQ22606.1 hypothetical protein IKC_06370 [Bacillus cereus VD184]